MKNSNKFIRLLKLSILLFCVILIIIGFAFGYLYNSYKTDSCAERPISYGVQKLNEINNDSFTCACTPISGNYETLSFDENGVVKNNLLTLVP